MCVPRPHSSFWDQDCNCHEGGGGNTAQAAGKQQPYSTPSHSEALATGEVSGLAQVSSITPFANCSLLHGKPTGSGGSPTPEHPTAKCQQGRGTQGLGRQLEPSCSSCNAEASPCPSMNFQDCKTETSSSGAVRLGCSSPGGNTQLIFHPVLPRAVDPPVPGAREPCWSSHSHSLSPLGALPTR